MLPNDFLFPPIGMKFLIFRIIIYNNFLSQKRWVECKQSMSLALRMPNGWIKYIAFCALDFIKYLL